MLEPCWIEFWVVDVFVVIASSMRKKPDNIKAKCSMRKSHMQCCVHFIQLHWCYSASVVHSIHTANANGSALLLLWISSCRGSWRKLRCCAGCVHQLRWTMRLNWWIEYKSPTLFHLVYMFCICVCVFEYVRCNSFPLARIHAIQGFFLPSLAFIASIATCDSTLTHTYEMRIRGGS